MLLFYYFSHPSLVWCWYWGVFFPLRVLISVERIFLGWICAILILRWRIWVAAISPMQTCAAQTWRERTFLEPTWMWADHLLLSFSFNPLELIWSLSWLLPKKNHVLQGANLQGVKMLCSNAEGASLKGCNFEDPSGLKANLEGKNPANIIHCLVLIIKWHALVTEYHC